MSGVLLLTSQSRIVASNPVTWLCDQELAQSFLNLSSAVPELWFSSSGGVCVCVRVCREPLYL